MSRIILVFYLIIIFIIIASCSRVQPTTAPTSIPEVIPSPTLLDKATSTLASGYPEPVIPAPTVDLGYPAPIEQIVTPLQTPTQDQSKGSLKGRLLLNDQPVNDVILSLAEVIRDSSGREMVVSYDPSSSPTTNTDSQGYFIFINISPNKYGLILDTIIKSYLIHYPDEEDKQILVIIEKGKEVDLGTLNYDTLPVQLP